MASIIYLSMCFTVPKNIVTLTVFLFKINLKNEEVHVSQRACSLVHTDSFRHSVNSNDLIVSVSTLRIALFQHINRVFCQKRKADLTLEQIVQTAVYFLAFITHISFERLSLHLQCSLAFASVVNAFIL